jgi:GAF domain-containing protein
MQPLPEIAAELDRLTAMSGGDLDMAELLRSISELAVAVVPTCVGVSISINSTGGLYTITATSQELAVVDAVQYLSGGPCVDCFASGEELYVPDVLDENQWQLAAEAAAARGVRSTLSMPLRDGQKVIGALNLYGGELNSFEKKERLVAGIFGARFDEVVSNADLSFMTREFARELPERLAASSQVDEAVGMLMVRHGWSAPEARERLAEAASKAGVPPDRLANALVELKGT